MWSCSKLILDLLPESVYSSSNWKGLHELIIVYMYTSGEDGVGDGGGCSQAASKAAFMLPQEGQHNWCYYSVPMLCLI